MDFSVVTPVFNGMPQIRACIGSVRNQDGVRVQHCIQDAGSTDGSAQWAEAQTDLDVRCEPDAGMYDAINRGWARSSGNILCWLNADEQYLPGTLRRVLDVFEKNPSVDVVYGNTIIVAPDGQPFAARREIPLRKVYVANGFLYALSCSLFFHRRLFDRGWMAFDPGYKNAGDVDLVLNLFDRGAVFFQLNAYLALYGVDGNNISITPRMHEELASVRHKHGALPMRWLQQLVLAGRYAERLIRGCYRADMVTYPFALNEKEYKTIAPRKAGSRFTYSKALKKLKKTR